MIKPELAEEFAEAWFAAWNAHDLDSILSHYAEDVVFTSPFVVAINGDETGTITGKEALRDYFARALAVYPDLAFTPMHALTSVSSVALVYRSVKDLIAAEVMIFGTDGKVHRVYAHYA